MSNLLAADKIKLTHSKKIILVLLIMGLLPLVQALNGQLTVHSGFKLTQLKDIVIDGATSILMIEKNGLTLSVVLLVFVNFFIGEEFQHGTIRNALSLGQRRADYYLAKLIMAAGLTFVAAVVTTVVGMLSYSVLFNFGQVVGIDHYFSYALQAFIVLYLLILANVAVYVAVTFITKNTGMAMVWGFLYTIGTGFVPGVFQQTEHFKFLTNWFTQTYLFYRNLALPAAITEFPQMILVSGATIILATILGIYIFKHTDIK
ncbi:ABC transporter permease [Loigolactobacillus zhaoyuanensis]|uniref:ABC transporter permease n=1 Tax=Loigolactobacillus zhaoyuanensis TaxID=2486017 RepID=A0ABW8UBN4_9LACO|nr:ABC transporter permease [Loigolactobacillus zhaoyuanensis]